MPNASNVSVSEPAKQRGWTSQDPMLLSYRVPLSPAWGLGGMHPSGRNYEMVLSAPTMVVFIISLVIAVIGILAALGTLAMIPLAAVWIVTIAYIVLALGVVLKGL